MLPARLQPGMQWSQSSHDDWGLFMLQSSILIGNHLMPQCMCLNLQPRLRRVGREGRRDLPRSGLAVAMTAVKAVQEPASL